MRRVIFGNSGSGKSTLAKQLATNPPVAYLDLDTIAWEAATPPTRKPLSESISTLTQFTEVNASWIVEGCYTSLLEPASQWADEIIFLDPGVDACLQNARNRPWEPHKYESKAAQDANLEMLLEWIANYETRTDEFSRSAHQAFFQRFPGRKTKLASNAQATAFARQPTPDHS